MPKTLVDRAASRKLDAEVDECWCVFDVEWPQNHPHLVETLQKARAHHIKIAVSNPCFELWLILHFEDLSAFVESAEAERQTVVSTDEPVRESTLTFT